MPIYEYECPSCSSRFEEKRGFHDTSPAACPKCRRKARRVFSPVPIIFKGSGFYVTDHKGNHGHSEPVAGSETTETAAPAKTKENAPAEKT